MNSTFCPRILMTVIGVVCLAAGQSAEGQWPTDHQNLCGPFVEFGAKIYDRPGDDSTNPIIVDSVTNQVYFDTGDITDLNGGAGAEVRFGSTGPRCRNWEARVFLTNWDTEYLFDQPNLSSPLSPMLDPDIVGITYDSSIYSLEFNLRKACTPGITFITGPRFIALNESLLIESETNVFIPPLGNFELLTSNEIVTTNRLIGGQIGALFNFPVSRDVYLHGFIRTGGYGNLTRLRSTAQSTIMPEETTVIRRDIPSFVGEVGGKIYCDIFPDLLTGFVGYEATWIDGVALAPVQAQNLNPTFVTTEVTAFFQAVTFGLQMRW